MKVISWLVSKTNSRTTSRSSTAASTIDAVTDDISVFSTPEIIDAEDSGPFLETLDAIADERFILDGHVLYDEPVSIDETAMYASHSNDPRVRRTNPVRKNTSVHAATRLRQNRLMPRGSSPSNRPTIIVRTQSTSTYQSSQTSSPQTPPRSDLPLEHDKGKRKFLPRSPSPLEPSASAQSSPPISPVHLSSVGSVFDAEIQHFSRTHSSAYSENRLAVPHN